MIEDKTLTSSSARDSGAQAGAHAAFPSGAHANGHPPVQVPLVALSDVALTGIYEISKILTAPNRLETTLASVVNLLSSFMQMRHGVISLLADDGIPDITVGVGWNEGTDQRYRARLPEKAIGQVVATAVPLVAENVASHPAFSPADAMALGATDEVRVSFIGVPIRVGGRVIGTLTIDRVWDGRSVFRLDSDVRFLTMVANLIAQTVQLHRVVTRDRERLMAESGRLQKELSALKPAVRERRKVLVDGIIGESPELRQLLDKITIVAKSHSPVLLRGESGTGKELIAKAIHELSSRAKGPFIKVNCAALPESVLESELFGHEKGAFTGAVGARKGRFELADKGTLFLDEIGEISPAFQAKLLRVLQEQEFERVGGSQTIKVNVRVVAATNKNLEEAVSKNEFRADLYYRITVIPILVPSLRDRRSDIPLLAGEFLGRFNKENARELSFGRDALDVLMACGFPGNVRELENCVQRTATLAQGAAISASDFACAQNECLSALLWKSSPPASRRPIDIPLPVVARPSARPEPVETGEAGPMSGPQHAAPLAAAMPSPGAGAVARLPAAPAALSGAADEAGERERLVDAMERAGWVQAKAARLLGLTPRQIGYALKKHDIEIKRF
ncbi:nif-specific transcriptional activator NifA [Xanthobacter tagetidis]|uniref:Nif-specific regulatory protein n=1 Tax=Xanthobacter tagetidis TaxID=60216 RepID=A0A3L7AQL2_9HYPH|nr:nif-specific transcriptional activator NifA [Xanthobacter tagetidis]MBB6308117.1 Nif-specific regulatory protein [Xanthobacter tagetidis]RLP81742.1 nif-specific transcriptional activator NifA [Xanthobacter tagetidis]